MTKTKLLLAVCALFLFTASQAAVTVKQGEKTQTYPNNTVVTVDGSADTVVNYNGLEVFVPKGSSVTLNAAANNSVVIAGKNLQGVKVIGLSLNTNGRASFVINQKKQTLSVRSGTVKAFNQAGQEVTVTRGGVATMDSFAQAQAANTVAAVTDNFVANDFSNVNTQQAVQNVEESEEVLSPSSPR